MESFLPGPFLTTSLRERPRCSGAQGLVTIERRLGCECPLDFDVHPTNVGHTFIAQQFEAAWR